MFFVSSRAWDKEKILSPHEESNFRPSDFNTELQRLYGEQGPLRVRRRKISINFGNPYDLIFNYFH